MFQSKNTRLKTKNTRLKVCGTLGSGENTCKIKTVIHNLTVIHFEQESHGLHPNNRDLQPSLTEAFKVLFKECGVHMLRPNIQIKNNDILLTLKIISSRLCLTKISLN